MTIRIHKAVFYQTSNGHTTKASIPVERVFYVKTPYGSIGQKTAKQERRFYRL